MSSSAHSHLWFSCALASFALASSVWADVTPHPLFSDGAVLQRGRAIPVWGTADNSERITVTLQGARVETACRDGRWRVDLPALKEGGPFEMTIAGKNSITIKNVLIGEVWIASGQSNMDMVVKDCDRAEEEIAKANHPHLRLCKVPREAADEVRSTVKVAWQECSPRTVGNISGVGYFFARDLHQALKVPIGLIDAAYGGTPAEAWMSPDAVRSRPEFAPILEEYAQQVQDSPRAMAQYHADIATWESAAAEAKTSGKALPPRPQLPMGPHNWRRPSGLYRGMIAPLAPCAMRGVIWYQGERNTPRAKEYRTLFPALIADWRKLWPQGDFPFLFSQLAPFGTPSKVPRESMWAELREAQLLTSQTVPNTAMAVITDVGDEKEIHPKRKQPVGARLALAARAIAYGEKVAYRGPTYRSHEVRGDKVILSFSDVGTGLECRGDELLGFAICGADKKFVNAKAAIAGDRIEVHSPQITQPIAVRFGWAEYPVVNLWNKDGLPAAPFRTDDPDAAASQVIESFIARATSENPRQSEGDIVVLRDGILLAAWSDFYGGSNDHAGARISAAKSTDGGRTWGPRFTLQENTGKANVMSVSFVRLQSGDLLLFYLQKNTVTDLKAHVRRSTDDGRSWGEATLVTPEEGYHVMNNARVIQLKSGRLLAPVATTMQVGTKNDAFKTAVYSSDDEGRTWRRGSTLLSAPKRGAMEPGLIECKDGRVLQIIRTQTGQIWHSYSADRGDTWSEARPWTIESPESPATLERDPVSGTWLLVWNPNVAWLNPEKTVLGANHGGPRTPLAAMVSHDEGKTWSKPRNLESDPAVTYAYTSITFHEGRALLGYYHFPIGGKLLSLKFQSVPLNLLNN
jgi:predicted neuraminidase